MTAARNIYGCEPMRRIVDPTPAEVIALTRRPGARNNRGRVPEKGSTVPITAGSFVTSIAALAGYRGDSVSLATGVNIWIDISANGKHLIQSTGSSQPVYSANDATLNNRGTLTFNGSIQEMTAASLAIPAAPVTILAVWKQISWTANCNCWTGTGVNAHAFFQSPITPQVRLFNGVAAGTVNNLATLGQWGRVLCEYTNSVSDSLKFGSGAAATGVNTGNSASTSFTLGSALGSAFTNEALAELWIWNGLLQPSEKTAIDAYITSYYGAGLV